MNFTFQSLVEYNHSSFLCALNCNHIHWVPQISNSSTIQIFPIWKILAFLNSSWASVVEQLLGMSKVPNLAVGNVKDLCLKCWEGYNVHTGIFKYFWEMLQCLPGQGSRVPCILQAFSALTLQRKYVSAGLWSPKAFGWQITSSSSASYC